MEKIRLFEAFAGYGSQAMALKRLGVPFESVGISEIDRYAISAYHAVHGDVKNFGDISKIDWSEVSDFDLFTYSFPCQDISSAGKQRGFEKGSGTRSSLLWECQRAIEAKRPQYLLMENVKALTQQKFYPYLKEWQAYLSSLGYSNYTQVLNAKDYGIPQNRERVFMVSFLNSDRMFFFPEPFKLETRLKDVLEQEVDEKYYLSKDVINMFANHKAKQQAAGRGFGWRPTLGEGCASAILTSGARRSDDNYIIEPAVLRSERTEFGKAVRKERGDNNLQMSRHEMTEQKPRTDGISNAITTVQKDNLLVEPRACGIRGRNSKGDAGSIGSYYEQVVEIGGNVANCLTSVQKDSMVLEPKIFQRGRGYVKDNIKEITPALTTSDYPNNNVVLEPRYGNSRVQAVVDKGIINPSEVQFIDAYNGSVVDDVAGTIKTTVDSSCLSFVTEPKVMCEGNTNPTGHDMGGNVFNTEGIVPTLTTNKGEGPKIIQVGNISKEKVIQIPRKAGFILLKDKNSGKNLVEEGTFGCTGVVEISKESEGTIEMPNLQIPQATAQGYAEVEPGGVFDSSYPNSTTRRGRVQDGGKITPALTATGEPLNVYEGIQQCQYRIRKLTPRECFRLQGVCDSDIDKIQAAGISNSQQYKMAGNSIVVDCLFHIFRKMFVDKGNESQQLTLFDF